MSQQTLAELQQKQRSSKQSHKNTLLKPTCTVNVQDCTDDSGNGESDPEKQPQNKCAHTKSKNSGNARNCTDLSGDNDPDDPDGRPKNTRYIPIPKWSIYHPWPSIGGIRHLVFFKDTNGFYTAFLKVGRIILIDEIEFFKCIKRITKDQK